MATTAAHSQAVLRRARLASRRAIPEVRADRPGAPDVGADGARLDGAGATGSAAGSTTELSSGRWRPLRRVRARVDGTVTPRIRGGRDRSRGRPRDVGQAPGTMGRRPVRGAAVGLAGGQPHSHLPLAYRSRSTMQRMTASGTSPSTGSPDSSLDRRTVLETSTGAHGHPDRAPPGRWFDHRHPGPIDHGQRHQVPQGLVVVPGVEGGHHVGSHHDDTSASGSVGEELVERCRRCTSAHHGRTRCGTPPVPAGRQVRRPRGRTGPRPAHRPVVLLPRVVGHHHQHAVQPERRPHRLRHLHVAGVDGIERAPEEPDPRARR